MRQRILAILLSTLVVLSVFFGVSSAGLLLLGGYPNDSTLIGLSWIAGFTLLLIVTNVLLLVGTLAFIQLNQDNREP